MIVPIHEKYPINHKIFCFIKLVGFKSIMPYSLNNGCPLIIWTEFELVYIPYLSVDLHQTFNTDALGH